jgi:PAP2 superfamily
MIIGSRIPHPVITRRMPENATGSAASRRGSTTHPDERERLAPFLIAEGGLWVLFYVGYLFVRGLALSGPAAAERHGEAIYDLESRLWSADLEGLVQAHTGTLALDLLARYYELAFLPVAAAVGIILASADRALYRELRTSMMAAIGLAAFVFALYPTAPPRLIPRLGIVDVVGMQDHDVGSTHGIRFNPYAAMPSMHVGWTLLVAIGVAEALRRRSRRLHWLPLLHPFVMTCAVIATGNHYVLDVVAGVAIAVGGRLIARAIASRSPDGRILRSPRASHA